MMAKNSFGYFVALAVSSAGLMGCTYTFAARVYEIEQGTVMPATFKWNGSGRGPVEMKSPSGEVFRGEYITVADDAVAWGQIFAAGSSGVSTATGYSVVTQGKQRGTAIVTGPNGILIECEYVTNASSPQGYGSCRDNKGRMYRLIFGGKASESPQ